MPELPPLPNVDAIRERLPHIFPEGSLNRTYCTRDIAARTFFVMLCVGAVQIEPDRNLPDIILVDLGPSDPLLVFVEVVATSGAVDERRRAALLAYATDAGYRPKQVAFVTAFTHRNEYAFKKAVSSLAWSSFAWFVAEPDHIMIFRRGDAANDAFLSTMMWV